VRARLFDVKQIPNTLGFARVAIVVPKLTFTAVRRNKLKRRMRELTRQHLWPVSASCDLVLRAKREAYDASFNQLREDVERLGAAVASGRAAAS
jgi:ribonuclease P protein component